LSSVGVVESFVIHEVHPENRAMIVIDHPVKACRDRQVLLLVRPRRAVFLGCSSSVVCGDQRRAHATSTEKGIKIRNLIPSGAAVGEGRDGLFPFPSCFHVDKEMQFVFDEGAT